METRHMQTYHDWCTCAPYVSPNAVVVDHPEAYPRKIQSVWLTTTRKLKIAVSLFCTLHSQHKSPYVNTHFKETRAAKTRWHMHTSVRLLTFPHTVETQIPRFARDRFSVFPNYRCCEKKIILMIVDKRLSVLISKVIDRLTTVVTSPGSCVSGDAFIPSKVDKRTRKRARCSRLARAVARVKEDKRSDEQIFNLANADWAYDRQVGEPLPLHRLIGRSRTTTGRPLTAYSPFSFPSLHLPLLHSFFPFPLVLRSVSSPFDVCIRVSRRAGSIIR